MSLQTIINISDSMVIDRRKVVGIQYTRNEIPRVNLTPTMNPWRFTLTVPSFLKYNQARDLIEELDRLDRVYPETIKFNNNPKLAWMFRYRGVASTNQIGAMRVVSFVGNQLVLGTLPAIGGTRPLFEKNDLIQIGNFPYPFTSTTQVLRGNGATVTVTTNRPNILTSNVVNQGITVGSGCQFKLFCPNMPTYKLVAGGTAYEGDTLVSNAFIEWSDSFQLYEYLGTV